MAGPRHGAKLELEVDMKMVRKSFRSFRVLMPEAMRAGLIEAMDIIGLTAVGRFMKPRQVVDPAVGKRAPRSGTKLNIDTGRLARSIQNAPGPRGNEGVREARHMGKDVVATIGSKVPYARIHEYGGHLSHISTQRTILIPARPYLIPALKMSEKDIYRILKSRLDMVIRRSK